MASYLFMCNADGTRDYRHQIPFDESEVARILKKLDLDTHVFEEKFAWDAHGHYRPQTWSKQDIIHIKICCEQALETVEKEKTRPEAKVRNAGETEYSLVRGYLDALIDFCNKALSIDLLITVTES